MKYKHLWNDSKFLKLKEWYGKKPTRELADDLGFPPSIIRVEAARLGLHFPSDLSRAEKWKHIRASPKESELIGKQWLLRNGFDYVNYFAEYENKNGGYRRRNFPFDYYAERRGERWFIDATVGEGKRIDMALAMIFTRFARLGILFVGNEDSYMVEVGRFKGHAGVNFSVINTITSHNGAVSIPPLSNRSEVKI